MIRKRLLAQVSVLSLLAGAALSQQVAAEVPLTINLGLGQYLFNKDLNLRDRELWQVGLEYAFTPNWSAELNYGFGEAGFKGTPDSADIRLWRLDGLYYFDTDNSLRPFLSFGIGDIAFDGPGPTDRQTIAGAGGGVRWNFTDSLSMRLDARAHHRLDENDNDYLMTVGVSYSFGSAGKKQAPAPAAAPVAVLDSDGDGVPDDRDECPNTPRGAKVDERGCELPVMATRIASIKLNVTFPFDSSQVQQRYFTDIKELADFLKRFTDVQVEIEGHTDNVGPETYNQGLSERRAKAVADVLINEHGIAASRLRPRGYGESRPVATNDTAEGRQQNRRVMATLEVEYEEVERQGQRPGQR